MYAIVEIGGMQFPVREGEVVEVPRLGAKAEDQVTFDKVLLVAGEKGTAVGNPYLPKASVLGEVVREARGEKIIVFKFKRRTKYRRKRGHRQWYTAVKINKIQAPQIA